MWWRAPLEGRVCALSGWGVCGSTGEVLCAFGTMGPHIYSWDCCALVVRTSIRLPSGSLSPLEEEGLLFTRYILGDTSRVGPGKSASVLAKEPLHHLLQWFFSSCSRKLGVPLELRQGPQGTSHVASVARVILEFISSRCRGIGPNLVLR